MVYIFARVTTDEEAYCWLILCYIYARYFCAIKASEMDASYVACLEVTECQCPFYSCLCDGECHYKTL